MGFFDVSFAFVCLIILASIPSFLAQNTQQDYLAAHNAARAQVGVGPMHWDKVVAAYAITYASKIQKENTCNNLVHSGGPYGENLAAAIPDLTGLQAVNMWVGEKSYYNYQSNSCVGGRVCGHYTQVVWKNSVGLGCARVRCNNGWWYIICNYDPPGNFVGQRPYVLNSGSWMRASPEPAPSASLAPGPSLAPSPLLALGPSLAPVPSVSPGPSRSKKPKKWKVGLSVGVVATFLSALALLFFCCKLRRRNGCLGGVRILMNILDRSTETPNHGYKGDDESLFFSFTSIQIATNHFSDENKLGQGGFGPVYKGKLVNGVEIAVKRLNRMSGHGIEQFKNEVAVISKLQHRNLVRLLGYCIHGEERLLIYEYLENKSLDSILFDVAKHGTLDWKRRLIIIEGIAQGLLYLHKYSRLRIIHRDLKTSNVLLDKDLNPKISDFGTARIFGDNEIRANTRTIVGTYGYMSPEYAMDGIFSEKSDVFSFGVMILEIISGKKNTSFYDSDRHLNLIGHVWDLWTEGRISEIVDSSLDETISKREILQYVQVGLLCVQENAADRPLMSDVVPMLQKESMILASPKRPAFSEIMSLIDTNRPENPGYCTVNTVTISDLDGR